MAKPTALSTRPTIGAGTIVEASFNGTTWEPVNVLLNMPAQGNKASSIEVPLLHLDVPETIKDVPTPQEGVLEVVDIGNEAFIDKMLAAAKTGGEVTLRVFVNSGRVKVTKFVVTGESTNDISAKELNKLSFDIRQSGESLTKKITDAEFTTTA